MVEVLYSKGKNDECYTPDYGVKAILPYVERYRDAREVKKKLRIWCPFDTKDSQFVKQLSKLDNVKVIHSHIEVDKDFFLYEPKRWDIMISNPPFTNKRAYFERALSFNKPFALIMTNTWLNDGAPQRLFKNRDLQLLMFDKRMRFISPEGRDNSKITFSSSYYCWNFLPKQIIMGSLYF